MCKLYDCNKEVIVTVIVDILLYPSRRVFNNKILVKLTIKILTKKFQWVPYILLLFDSSHAEVAQW